MRRAFTAIELAVVFVLIAVLAALLVPALEKGRQGAIRTKCLARVREVGMSFTMYQMDHNSSWPWARHSVDPDHEDWPDPTGSLALLYPAYASKAYTFCCPSTEDVVSMARDGKDFLNCENFHVSPRGKAMREEDEGKGAPSPPSYFYDAGGERGPGVPRNARPNRVVYGDECVHYLSQTEDGEWFLLGDSNHMGGGNFLFVDKHVEWLDVSWTGKPYHRGSEPSVPNPHLLRRSPSAAMATDDAEKLVDSNVFWPAQGGGRSPDDADLSGMMWFDGSWKEF